jgi:hypothetical protein
MSLVLDQPVYESAMLATVQKLPDAPFGMLFLRINIAHLPAPLFGTLTTQSSEETSNDGKSKLDPIYDEDEDDDEEIPETY